MKVMSVRTTKGHGNFVASAWVLENAVDTYKAWMSEHSKAHLSFEVLDGRMETNANGSGTILAYTVDGFNYNVRVD